MSVQARANTDTDHVVGIVQIERHEFAGEPIDVIVDANLADLRKARIEFAEAERLAGRLPA